MKRAGLQMHAEIQDPKWIAWALSLSFFALSNASATLASGSPFAIASSNAEIAPV